MDESQAKKRNRGVSVERRGFIADRDGIVKGLRVRVGGMICGGQRVCTLEVG